MNDRNRDLFFNDDTDENVIITMNNEDGSNVDAQVLALVGIEELGKEYVAVLPVEEQEQEESDEMEALIFTYLEDEEGNPVFEAIEEEEEHEIVSSVFSQIFSDAVEEEEDDDIESGYLDDIGDVIPGVSIQRD